MRLYKHNTKYLNYPVIDENSIIEYIHKHHLNLVINEVNSILECYKQDNLLLQIQLQEKGLIFNLLSSADIDDAVVSSVLKRIKYTVKKHTNIELMHTVMNNERLMQIQAYN